MKETIYWNDYEKIEDKHSEQFEKFLNGEITKKEYKDALIKFDKEIDKYITYYEDEESFIQDMKAHHVYENPRKEWAHEKEHYNIMKEQGLKPKIGVLHLAHDLFGYSMAVALTSDNQHEFIEKWTKKKYLKVLIQKFSVSKPSKDDKESIKYLKEVLGAL